MEELDINLEEEYSERAAIKQYDAGMTSEEAEAEALKEVEKVTLREANQ